jgi:hypothetical protein
MLAIPTMVDSLPQGASAKSGDMVGIVYRGKGVSKAGKQYNRYEVVVQRQWVKKL